MRLFKITGLRHVPHITERAIETSKGDVNEADSEWRSWNTHPARELFKWHPGQYVSIYSFTNIGHPKTLGQILTIITAFFIQSIL